MIEKVILPNFLNPVQLCCWKRKGQSFI